MRRSLIPDFPECQYILELVQVEEDKRLAKWFGMIEVREATHELKMAQADCASDHPWELTPGGDILASLTFARMRAELSKVPAILEHLALASAEGFSVVVFVNFLPTLDALIGLCAQEHTPEVIYGNQKIEERTEAIRIFQAGKTRVLFSTIDSGGASINLHDETGGAPRLALICPTWRATSLRQALGRVHRAGSKSKSVQKLLYAAGTVEEGIAARVMGKLDQIDTINDADLAEPEFVAA
jgi:SNF2 family DNA or RNA helicase